MLIDELFQNFRENMYSKLLCRIIHVCINKTIISKKLKNLMRYIGYLIYLEFIPYIIVLREKEGLRSVKHVIALVIHILKAL